MHYFSVLGVGFTVDVTKRRSSRAQAACEAAVKQVGHI